MGKLKAGLVGLPNVGKSTIFELFTRKGVLIANYPFSTIDPNIGSVEIYDKRVIELGKFFKSKKLTFDTLELVDIAGIIKGAAQKLGLGGEFLSQIRNVDIILHVVRCFQEERILHVEEKVDAVRDLNLIRLELILADLQQANKRVQKLQKLSKKADNKTVKEELETLEKVINYLERETAISEMNWLTEKENQIIAGSNFLSAKKSLIIANYGENDWTEIENLKEQFPNSIIFPLEVKAENEYKEFSIEEQIELGWNSFNREKFFQMIKECCNIKTFFTAGITEVRSWSTNKEATAVQCSGLIHSDIQNRFIKCEVYNVDDLFVNSREDSIKKFRRESSSYIIKEGDVCNFLFNKK